jgi:leucyl aminopeptidase (aminopeptidase T)
VTPVPRSRPEDHLAAVVLGQCLGVRRGERVTVESWDHSLPWARAFVAEARRCGCEPTLVVEDEATFFRSLAGPGPGAVPGAPAALAEASDAYVYLPGPEDFSRLRGLSSEELAAVVGRHGPGWWRAARRAGLRAAWVAVAGATPSAAARYGVDPAGWQRDVLRASLVPPERLARAAEPIVRRLARARHVRIRHPNGTDLTVGLDPGAGVVEDGRVDRADRAVGRLWTSVPAGRASFAVSEGLAEGTWESNRPVYDRYGDPAVTDGVRFSIVRGRLREFSFERGGAAFAAAYARGGRGRDVPAALTFGLNPAVVRGPELDDLAVGTVGLLLGDNRSAGGHHRSRFSYLTTLSGPDLDLDGKSWWVGGRPVRPSARLSAGARRPSVRRRQGAPAPVRRTRP